MEKKGYNLTARYIAFAAVLLAAFLYLVGGLADLQLRSSDVYTADKESKRTTTVTLRGSRGMITDADAVIFAHDEKIYNVTFYRDASQNSKAQYLAFTKSIGDTIDIIEKNGYKLSVDFVIRRKADAPDEWEFNFGSKVSEAVLQTRENQWRSNNYLSVTYFPTAESCINKLKERFRLYTQEDAASLTEEERAGRLLMSEQRMLQTMAVFSEMQMNLFNSQPIVIAKDVSYETVIEIETRSMLLPGMEVAVGTKRVYPRGTLASQVIGYLGAIPSEAKWAELKLKGYKYSDTIGVDGIEASMEDWLTQNSDMRQGYRVVERDRVGKVTRELSYTEPQDGNNVKLTIRASYQQQAERALADNVASTRAEQEKKLMLNSWLESNKEDITRRDWTRFPLSLAERAAMMVVDMQGRVLAMANYPTFDLNALVAAGEESQAILTDSRHVLMNYNIHARGTPGSIFKMVSALGAMLEGELWPDETISDGGKYTRFTTDLSTAPQCWISPRLRYEHQNQTIIQGLQNSCNYFFYTLGDRLGETRLYKYASMFGLTSTTGVDLPGEERSVVGTQNSLYDPNKAMDEASQDTALPIIVFNSIKKHLRNQGASYNITYDDERLNRCVKRLMDMAIKTNQSDWTATMRPILMEELNMTQEMVNKRVIISDTYNYLNDIKWGGGQTIQVAIGQSITVLTPAAVARYVCAIANGGTVYNLTLVDSVTSPEGDIVSQRSPTYMTVFEGAEEYLPYIHEGMKGVVDESGTAGKYFKKWEYRDQIAAKTGTAEVTAIDLENNAWFVCFAPYEKPEIAIVVFIPSGLSGGEASLAAKEFVTWYMDQKTLRTDDVVFPSGNMLAP